jgi:NTP pyrophosphatase (non-canonical NTP hydrolase)
MQKGKEFDIAKNVRLVEWLKSEILTSVAELFKMLAGGMKETQDVIADCLASIILACYLLGKRLGIEFAAVDRKVEGKIRLGIIEEHDVETDFGDLSELSRHIKESRE